MSHIVDAFGNKHRGYPKINLDQVAKFVPRSEGYECLTAGGESLGTISGYEVKENAFAIVPETRQTTLIAFCLCDEELRIDRLPVIAWRFDSGRDQYPTPICCTNYEADNVEWCLEIHESPPLWIFPGDRAFTTLDEAAAYARKELQSKARQTA